MRNTVINTIFQQAQLNKDIIFITADLGYSVIENFQRELPEQFINVGIAEQNMIGLAAGLALAGKKVFVYSIVPFVTLRCLEQIKVDICYQNLDITIIGVGGGFAYGSLGVTHHAIEDLGVMRTLPNMKVVAPSDPEEAKKLITKLIDIGGPAYLRLNRGGEKNIISEIEQQSFKFGEGRKIRGGGEILILAIGAILENALTAVEKLAEQKIIVSLVSLPVLKPLNKEYLEKIVKEKKVLITLEEHNIIGGLGSAVAEFIAERGIEIKFKRLGVLDTYPSEIGRQDYLRELFNLSADKITEVILGLIK